MPHKARRIGERSRQGTRLATRKAKIRSNKKTKDTKQAAKPSYRLVHGDALEFLRELSPGSVDLIVSSPPYCMGKAYENSLDPNDFVKAHKSLAPALTRALRDGGSICWQVGHHVQNGVVAPLDALVYPIFAEQENLFLRNRIVWTFGHGVHASRRFSGRHETVLWFTKGHSYYFDLDSVRVPQKYPGKKHYKGPFKGQFSGNPLGKNPSDVWEIPNVKSRHPEKTAHPCQFPIALVQRLIRSLCPKGGFVVDPFSGSGTAAAASALEGRSFAGCDKELSYLKVASVRVRQALEGTLNYRPLEREIYVPRLTDAVAIAPKHFLCSQP